MARLAALWPSAQQPANLALSVTPNTLTADYKQTTTVTAVVTGADGSAVANQKVLVTVSGFGNSFTSTAGLTDSSGTFVCHLKSFGAQQKVITAVAGSVKDYAIVTYSPGPPDPQASALVVTPKNGLAADGRTPCLINAIVADTYRNRIAEQAVTISATGYNNVIDAPSGSTTSLGTYSTTLVTTTAETKNITLSVGGAKTVANVQFVGGEPNAAMTSVVVSPNGLAVAGDGNDAYFLATTVRDVFGNPVTSYPVALSNSGVAGRFDAAEGVTNNSGIFSTLFRASQVGNAIIYIVAGPFSTTESVSFVVGAPRGDASSVVVTPSSVVADGNAVAQILVTARDAAKNPVPGQTITLSIGGSNNNLAQSSGTTDGNGVFSTTLSSSTAETKLIIFQAGGASSRGYASFVAGQPNAYQSSFIVSPNEPVAADRSGTFLLRATVLDSFANPIKGAPVVFSSTSSGDVFSALSGTTSPFGIASGLLRSSALGAEAVTVQVGSLTLSANVVFGLGPLNNAQSSFVASPSSSVVADGNSVVTLSATLRDAVGHPLANQNYTISSSGVNDVVGGTPSAFAGVSDGNGNLSTTLTATRAERKTVLLGVNGMRMAINVSFVPGPPVASSATLTIYPPSAPADNRTTVQASVSLSDLHGNGCVNAPVNIAISGANNTIGQDSGKTGYSGAYATIIRSSKAELKQITATSGNITLQQNVVFGPGIASPSATVLSIVPNSNITADFNSAAQLAATVVDAFGNPLANTKVYFSSNLSGALFTPHSGLLDANGSIQSTMVSKTAGASKVILQVGPVSLSGDIAFVAGSPNAPHSSFVAIPPAGITANAVSYASVTVVVRDQYNNPVANAAVSLSSTDSNDVFAATSGNTDLRGQFLTKLRSTTSGTKVLSMQSPGVTLQQNIAFIAGAPNSTLSSFVADTNTLAADNNAIVTLSATLRDGFNNAVPGVYVSFASPTSRNTFVPMGGLTTAAGTFQTTWKSSQAATKQARLTAGTFTAISPNITFTPGSPNGTMSRLLVSPAYNNPANGNAVATLTATVVDVFGNALSGQPVSFSSNGNGDTFTNPSGNTGADGTYSTTMGSTGTGTKTITFVSNAITKTATIQFISSTSSLWSEDELRLAMHADKASVGSSFGPGWAQTPLLLASLPPAPEGPLPGQGASAPQATTACDFAGSGRLMPVTAQQVADILAGEVGRTPLTARDAAAASSRPTFVCVDVDGDGRQELLTSDLARGRCRLLALGADGKIFLPKAPDIHRPVPISDLVVGDLDGDGRTEIVLASSHGVDVIAYQPGRDAWHTIDRPLATAVCGLRLIDLDGDPFLDLAAMRLATRQEDLLQGRGDGTFVPALGALLPAGPLPPQ